MGFTLESSQLPPTKGTWPRYVVSPLTPLNREEPGAKDIYLAYMQLGPCRTKDAMAYALGLPEHQPEGTLKYWDARLKKEGDVVLEGRAIYPEPPIAVAGRDLGFLREWWQDRKAHRLAVDSAKTQYRKKRNEFNNLFWHWQAYHAFDEYNRLHVGQIKVSRPRNPTPPRPILKEIYFEEYRKWRRELLGQSSEPATS